MLGVKYGVISDCLSLYNSRYKNKKKKFEAESNNKLLWSYLIHKKARSLIDVDETRVLSLLAWHRVIDND